MSARRAAGAPFTGGADALTRLRDYDVCGTHLVAGLMSGTSADGVDAVLLRLERRGDDLGHEVVGWHASPFDPVLRREILDVSGVPEVAPERLMRLDAALGEHHAAAALELFAAARVVPGEVNAIGMHGQTVRHVPRGGMGEAYSLQIGSAAVVAERTGVTVVSDFRRRDIAAGGEGAPLVPLADWWLFRSPDESRVLLNLGGMANLTYLPRGGAPESVLAFDTGPGNAVLDGLARLASDGARTLDEDGESAARGTPGESLLAELLADPFFSKAPPRSTGREHFGDHYAVTLRDVGHGMGLSDDDVMATAVALTAASVAGAIDRFVRPLGAVDRVYASGGGVRNAALMRALASRLAPAPLEELGVLGVDPQAKEAMAFAYLAHRTLCGLPGNLPAATGASHPVVLGTITPGR